jgi:hypothetical protein
LNFDSDESNDYVMAVSWNFNPKLVQSNRWTNSLKRLQNKRKGHQGNKRKEKNKQKTKTKVT